MISKPACIHRVLENNIQEFVLTEVSRRAVDELFDMTEQMLQSAADNRIDDTNTTGAVLIDSSVGLQSLNHSLYRLRAMMGHFPQQKGGRIALIMPTNYLTRSVAMLMRPIVPARIYTSHERAAAIAWLSEPVIASTRR